MKRWMEDYGEAKNESGDSNWNSTGDVEKELMELEQSYIDITLAGYRMMGLIDKKRRDTFKPVEAIDNLNAIAVFENGYIKVTVPKLPEKVEVWKYLGTGYAKRIHDYWQTGIRKSLQELDREKDIRNLFSNCNIIIRILKDSNRDWDVDNFHIKYIIDGIRYAGVISDDAWYRVHYLVMGKDARDRNVTEIYIMDSKDFVEVLSGLSE